MEHNCLVVGLPEELDHHRSEDVKAGIGAQMAEQYVRRLVFDFSRTRFMDSSGIGVLLGRYKEMKGRGGDLILCGMDEQIRRILRISGIPGLVPCVADRQSAVGYPN